MAKFQNAWERSGAFEGDIVLTKEQREALIAEYSGMKNSVLSAISLWPNNTMYYHIDERYYSKSLSIYSWSMIILIIKVSYVNVTAPEQITLIQKSIDILQKVSCVKIKRRTSNINDYVLIQVNSLVYTNLIYCQFSKLSFSHYRFREQMEGADQK